MSSVHESLEKVANLAFGCVWAGCLASAHAALDPAALLPVAVGAAGLIGVVASDFAKAGPESKRKLERIRRRVREKIDTQIADYRTRLEIDDVDGVLGDELLNCFLDREALVGAAADPSGFPIRATQLVMEALARRREDLFGGAAPEAGRKYAQEVISTALWAAIEDREYFEEIQSRLTFAQSREIARILESNGRIEAAVARIEDQIQALPSNVREVVDLSNRAWHGLRLETGRSEPANERVQIRPTELLLPRYRIAPFVDREGLLSSILSWVTRPTERRATGRLYVAPGGSGKTRLGIELAIQLESLGWRCGFVPKAHGGSLAPGALRDLMASAGAVGVCVVVDYAESLIRELGELADAALASGSAGPPIRIVAFARSPEGWWSSFAGDPSPSAVFDPTPFGAISEQLSAKDCSEIFAQSRAAFVDKLRAVGLPHRKQAQAPSLAGADRPLLVVALAFLDAIGVDLRGRSVFQTLYEEERRQWRRVLQVEADDEVADLARAAAQVTLVQGATVDGAAALMRADDTDRGIARPKILMNLRRLYGARAIQGDSAVGEGEDIPFINPLEPDLLGEHMCMEVIQESGAPLLDATLRAALSGPPLFRDDAERVLAVLARATHPNHDPKVRHVAERAIASIATLVPKLSAFQVGHLANSLPPNSLALSEFALIVARRLVEVAPQDSSEAALRQRADTQSYLSARLSRRGFAEEALAASEGAVNLHRQLARIKRNEYMSGLAAALHLHSQDLVNLGRRRQAVAPAEEAVELRRELAETSPEMLGSSLAETLNNLAQTYASIGWKDKALAASKEACTRFEALAAENPDRFLRSRAGALNSLANRFAETGQAERALEATREALGIDRQLVAKNRDAYLAGLAVTLNNFSRDLLILRRADEALSPIVESVEIHRELARKNRGGELLGLALALKGSGEVHFDAGQAEIGLASIQESIGLLRELVTKGSDAVVPELARALADRGKMLVKLARRGEACADFEEAARLIRPYAIKFPDAFGPLFSHLRDEYMRSSIGDTSEQAAPNSIPDRTPISHAIPEGSTAFDEADKLLKLFMRGLAAGRASEASGAPTDEEAAARLEHVLIGEKAMVELTDFLAENSADKSLEPVENVARYLGQLMLRVEPEGEAAAARFSELLLRLKRARATAHPGEADVRRALAEALLSGADDLEHGAEHLQELRELRIANPGDSVIAQFDAWALHIQSNNAAVQGDQVLHDLKLDELRNLSTQYEKDTVVLVALAKSLKNSCKWAIGMKDIGRRDASLNELRGLNSRCPESAAIRLQLAEALCLVLMDDVSSGDIGPYESGAPIPLLVELWDLVKNHPEDSELMELFRSLFQFYEADESDRRIDPATLI